MSLFRTHDVGRVAGGPWLRAQLKKLGDVIGLAFLAGLTAACSGEIKIENGEVPEEYLSVVESYLGSYSGEFNSFPGQIELSLDGRQLIAQFQDLDGQAQDLLDPRCSTEIGLLKSVGIREVDGEPTLRWATFGFSPGDCPRLVTGRVLDVEFEHRRGNLRFYLSLLQRWESVQRCEWERDYHHQPPVYRCRTYREGRYLTGRFGF